MSPVRARELAVTACLKGNRKPELPADSAEPNDSDLESNRRCRRARSDLGLRGKGFQFQSP